MAVTPALRYRTVALLIVLIALVVVFQLAVRPWFQSWGATREEAQWILPGDDIVPAAAMQNTRAITVNAPADRVWPWLAQLGQDRAGFYSYDLLENAVGSRMPSIDALRPELQHWDTGDRLWMYPPDRAGGIGFATLRAYEPGRALGFATRVAGTGLDEPEDGSWSLVVVPNDDGTSRLLVRGRAASGRSFAGRVFDRLIFEPAHFVMERRMMQGIAQLSTGVGRHRWINHAQVALWTVTFMAFVVAAAGVLRRSDWARALAAFAAAGSVFQLLTLAQPPMIVAIALTAIPIAILIRTHRERRRREDFSGTAH